MGKKGHWEYTATSDGSADGCLANDGVGGWGMEEELEKQTDVFKKTGE